MWSFADLHIEFLFTVLNRLVFRSQAGSGGRGDCPLLYNFRGRVDTSVI